MNDELRNEVLTRRRGGQSARRIARELHISRRTVAKVIAEHQEQRAKARRACLGRRSGAAAKWTNTRPRCGITCRGIPT